MSRRTLTVTQGAEAIANLCGEWDSMARTSSRATPFQRSGWYTAWLENAGESKCSNPVVLLLRDGVRPRAGLALQVRAVSGRQRVEPLSTPWSDYHDAVGQCDETDTRRFADALLDIADRNRASIELDEVVPGGILDHVAHAAQLARHASSSVRAIDLTDDSHVSGVLSRKEHTTKSRRLARRGEVRLVHRTKPEDLHARFPEFVEMHRAQWRARPDTVAPFDDSDVEATFRGAIDRMATDGLVVLTELVLGERPLAMYIGFRVSRRYFGYRTAFDTRERRLSPGHLLLRYMMQDFRRSGLQELDLMRGAYAYKDQYCNIRRTNAGYRNLSPTAR